MRDELRELKKQYPIEILVYLDPLPVTLEDLGVPVAQEDHYSYTVEEERSVLAVHGVYNQDAWSATARDRRPGLFYTITETPLGLAAGAVLEGTDTLLPKYQF